MVLAYEKSIHSNKKTNCLREDVEDIKTQEYLNLREQTRGRANARRKWEPKQMERQCSEWLVGWLILRRQRERELNYFNLLFLNKYINVFLNGVSVCYVTLGWIGRILFALETLGFYVLFLFFSFPFEKQYYIGRSRSRSHEQLIGVQT